MPLDPRARRFLDLIAGAAREPGDDELEAFRRATDGLAEFAAPPAPVEREEHVFDLAGRRLKARVYAPLGAGADLLPGLVYFHGGGLVSGDLDSHDAICASLADAGSCRVIAVHYRLAPNHRFPAAHDDAREVLQAVAADPGTWRVDPARLAVGGDSAGGGLAVTAARDSGLALKLLLLLCPVLDPLAREPSRFALARGFLIEEATLERYWALYRSAGVTPDDPRVAPLRAAHFRGFPPTRIHGAEFDPLKDEGELLARQIRAAGGEASAVVHAGLIHHFYGLTAIIPAAREALRVVGEDLRQGLA